MGACTYAVFQISEILDSLPPLVSTIFKQPPLLWSESPSVQTSYVNCPMRTDGKFCRNSISCVSEHIPLIQTAAPFLRHTDKKKTSYRFLPTDHLSHDEDDGDEGESDKEEERVRALHQDEALVVAHRLHHSHSAEGYTRPVQRTHAERPGNNLEEKRTVQNWRCCHLRRIFSCPRAIRACPAHLKRQIDMCTREQGSVR